MKKSLLLLPILLLLAACRSNDRDRLPEVKPLDGDENVHITLNVNINDSPAGSSEKKSKKTFAAGKKRKAEKRRSGQKQVILSPKTEKQLEKKQAQRKRHELVPSGVGIIDSELNSVEQSYLKEVRSRREQQVWNSERHVFGSFSPGNIFKAPAE